MRFQRLAAATVTIAAIIGLSGCASGSTGPTASTGSTGAAPAPSASVTPVGDPLAEFITAAKTLEKETMRFSMTMPGGIDASGSFDLPGSKADMTMTMGAEKFAMRLIGKTLYMKYDTEWMSLDVSKLPANSPMNPSNMAANTEFYTEAATNVQRTGDSFKGTLDIAKSPTADAESLKALGGKSTEVPFTAEVDDKGRLIEMTIDMTQLAPAAGKMTAKYYDFGTKVVVKAPPASQVKPMPKEMLKILAAQGKTTKA
ncbi:hypothetical protein QLQ12_04495 [Actinoplanes sp. NEAU-A12]|uniref:LppX_LprAFG lipoprotein n=1 Tax=Actinoplanes sandaracinus TaxID=3045177 RepID=A0ABT6WDP2_9ACTN|nr:hypothetical protein [Actinoplanes sandaracinus]MDI6097858.1 hypothetical protein [Actinoplanes sandaracinus]